MTEYPYPSHQRLLEVAALLPQDAATILAALEANAQIYVLRLVATSIDYWEQHAIQLDLVQFDAVVGSMVAVLAPTVRSLDQAVIRLNTKDSSCGSQS